MGGGGGGGPQTVSQTTIPAYAKPYMEGLLGKAASATIGAPVKDPETGEITFEDGPDYQPYDVGGVIQSYVSGNDFLTLQWLSNKLGKTYWVCNHYKGLAQEKN
jgi:hypothetical protein